MSKVNVYLADGFEEVEGLTVVDLLRRAGIETDMVSIMGRKEITGARKIPVLADKLFEEQDDPDVIVLPGGMPGTLHLKAHEGLADLIRKQTRKENCLQQSVQHQPSMERWDFSKERMQPAIRAWRTSCLVQTGRSSRSLSTETS